MNSAKFELVYRDIKGNIIINQTSNKRVLIDFVKLHNLKNYVITKIIIN